MLGKLKKFWRGEEGFTLVELMVVVIILGILAAVAVPMYLKNAEAARESAAQTSLANMKSVIDTFTAQNNGTYPTAAIGASPDISGVIQASGINWTDDSTGIQDPWQNGFNYETITNGTQTGYIIYAGPDANKNYWEASSSQSPFNAGTAVQVPTGWTAGTPVASWKSS